MTIEQIITILTPFLAGSIGIFSSLIVFINKIKNLKRIVTAQLTDNETIKNELQITRQALTDLSQKLNFLVEETRKNAKR